MNWGESPVNGVLNSTIQILWRVDLVIKIDGDKPRVMYGFPEWH